MQLCASSLAMSEVLSALLAAVDLDIFVSVLLSTVVFEAVANMHVNMVLEVVRRFHGAISFVILIRIDTIRQSVRGVNV